MNAIILAIGIAAAAGLIVLLVVEMRSGQPKRMSLESITAASVPVESVQTQNSASQPNFLMLIFAQHPAKVYATVETLIWVVVLASLIDHLRSVDSTTSTIIWYLTIGPHELGHLVCLPFGQFLYIAGGSFWQVMFWALLGLYTLLVRRQISFGLLLWAVAGHSAINLSRYIGDASARQMPLLFGLGPEHHDWWMLLKPLGWLGFDKTFAAIAVIIAVGVVVFSAVAGILTTWLLPRVRLGRYTRFRGNPLRAIIGTFAILREHKIPIQVPSDQPI